MDGCSTEWSYFTPYEPDISAALNKLRAEVFARGDYITEESPIAAGHRLMIPPPIKHKLKPSSIEELLEQQGNFGTHSILDIICISLKSKRKAISPFPQSLLVEYFGSETPTPAQIQETYEFGSLEKFVTKRWRGIYIVAHFEGKASDIFFAGSSGD